MWAILGNKKVRLHKQFLANPASLHRLSCSENVTYWTSWPKLTRSRANRRHNQLQDRIQKPRIQPQNPYRLFLQSRDCRCQLKLAVSHPRLSPRRHNVPIIFRQCRMGSGRRSWFGPLPLGQLSFRNTENVSRDIELFMEELLASQLSWSERFV